MKVARKVIGPLVAVILLAVFYLPNRGQTALDENLKQLQQCSGVIADYFPTPGEAVPSNGCFERYMERREQILWRYYFVRTLASHL